MRSWREQAEGRKRWDWGWKMPDLGGKQESPWRRKCIREQLEADNISTRRLSTSPRMCTSDLRARYEGEAELPTGPRN